jgi:hypothetical protein
VPLGVSTAGVVLVLTECRLRLTKSCFHIVVGDSRRSKMLFVLYSLKNEGAGKVSVLICRNIRCVSL